MGGLPLDLFISQRSKLLVDVARAHGRISAGIREGQAKWRDVNYDPKVGVRRKRSRPTPKKPHELVRGRYGWKCKLCRRRTATVTGHHRLMCTECKLPSLLQHLDVAAAACQFGTAVCADTGRPVEPLHFRGHDLFGAGTLVFCGLCGFYADSKLRKLSERCPATLGKAQNSAQRRILRRLWSGLHPVSIEPIGSPVPITADRWRARMAHAADVEQPPATSASSTSLLELLVPPASLKVVIPANATVGGVPLRRLGDKTADPVWKRVAFKRKSTAPHRAVAVSSDGTDISSSADSMSEE